MSLETIGAGAFGLVMGWITYRTLRRKEGEAALSDIATVLAALGGATVTGLFQNEDLFGMYAIGLAVGFFAYLIVSLLVTGKSSQIPWMGE